MSNRVNARHLQDLQLTKAEVIRDAEGPEGASPPRAEIFMHTPRRDMLEGPDLKVGLNSYSDCQSFVSRSAVSPGHF